MAKQKVKTTVKTRVKKNGTPNKDGYMLCNICKGSGLQKIPNRKKK